MIYKDLKKRFFTSIILLVFVFFIFKFKYLMGLILIIFGVLSILEFLNLSKKIFNKSKFYFLISNTLFISYIVFFSYFFFLFSVFENLKILLLIILLTCVASDIGGYIFGNLLKGPKLSKISPKKTISGAVGSLFFSCSTILIIAKLTNNYFSPNLILVGICSSTASQLGDLFFSYLKRKAKIKDTGNILPGHGGILDRLDGIFFGLPIGLLTILFAA